MNLSDAEARMVREALTDAIKWGVSYAFMYEELPGDERIQKRVDQLIKALLDAKAGKRRKLTEPLRIYEHLPIHGKPSQGEGGK